MGKEGTRLFHFFIIFLLDLRNGGLCKGRRRKVIGEPRFPVLFSPQILSAFAIDPAVTEPSPKPSPQPQTPPSSPAPLQSPPPQSSFLRGLGGGIMGGLLGGMLFSSLGFGANRGGIGGGGIGLFEILIFGALLFGIYLVFQEKTSGSRCQSLRSKHC